MADRDEHRPISVWHHRPTTPAHTHRHPPTMAMHDHAVVGFFVHGTAEFLQREAHTIVAGDLQLLPAGEPHRLVRADDV
ncbi:MAG TPA: AraC family ligand binding domain-containing protein, partial [Myxococcota bacterium]